MEKSIRISAPSSVSNLGCGFDILGFALENPFDEMIIRVNSTNNIRIKNLNQYNITPENPNKNVAGVAVQAMLDKLKTRQGFDIDINKQIKPGSGIGSSAASSTGAVFAVNELLNNPLEKKDLVSFAMAGEYVASGSEHADNVAPALLGGIILIRDYQPLDIIEIDPPEELYCVLVHPQIEIKTSEAREILHKNVPLKDAINQWGNVGGLVTGLLRSDYDLISRSIKDHIIEPQRSKLISGYDMLKKSAMDAGSLGCNISGSGPSVFALAKGLKSAQEVLQAMKNQYAEENIDFKTYISGINASGVKALG